MISKVVVVSLIALVAYTNAHGYNYERPQQISPEVLPDAQPLPASDTIPVEEPKPEITDGKKDTAAVDVGNNVPKGRKNNRNLPRVNNFFPVNVGGPVRTRSGAEGTPLVTSIANSLSTGKKGTAVSRATVNFDAESFLRRRNRKNQEQDVAQQEN